MELVRDQEVMICFPNKDDAAEAEGSDPAYIL